MTLLTKLPKLKYIALGLLTCFLVSAPLIYQYQHSTLAQTQTPGTDIKISENNRYLTRQDGTPFFWLADTVY
ncbi:MAG: hypothetical protein LDL41_17250, partial [Coleofasciculus sp. S288]|nr:hypothetical protein [Coleofasciculus sp. S288]